MHVLIADNLPTVRHALRLLLEQTEGMHIVGEAANTHSLLAQAKALTPDLVLLGGNLPGLTLTELLPVLRRANPGIRIIVLSTQPETSATVLVADADAFLSKTETPERLLEVICRIMQGKEECTMKYRVHRLDISMTRDQLKLEQFLNSLDGEVVAIIPNVTLGITAPHVDFLLIVEKVA